MIRTTGTFSKRQRVLMWTRPDPDCGQDETRAAPHQLKPGACLKTHCRRTHREVIVVVGRVIP